MVRNWYRWVGILGAAGGVALLAPRAAAWLQPPAVPPPEPEEPPLHAVLREPAGLLADEPLPPHEVVALPDGPGLRIAHAPAHRARLQRLRRCTVGDGLVTLEQRGDGRTEVAVRRRGQLCYRLQLPGGSEAGPPAVRLAGTVDPAGEAGPLAVVYSLPLEPEAGGGGLVVHREELHLLLIDLDGTLLLERALETRAGFLPGHGERILLQPAIWDGEALLVWSSARRWAGDASQCLGSLLHVPARGPVAVAEGLPCELVGVERLEEVEGVALHAATAANDGRPWEALVDRAGDFVATWAGETAEAPRRLAGARGPALLVAPPDRLLGGRLVAWPWTGEGLQLPPDDGMRFGFDWSGSGAEEVVLGGDGDTRVIDAAGGTQARFPGTPLAGRVDGGLREIVVQRYDGHLQAVGAAGGVRQPPGEVRLLRRVLAAGNAFDWTGDGSNDLTLAGVDAAGGLWIAAWAEGDLAFAWQVDALEELPPRHQAPRALSLVGEGPEVLRAENDGFAVRSVPDGALRWSGSREEGVLDAWAIPAGGPSAVAVR